jgi:hypothetical protein
MKSQDKFTKKSQDRLSLEIVASNSCVGETRCDAVTH